MTVQPPQGILTALVTPYASDGSVDLKAAATLLEFQAEKGVDGTFLLGTSGESILLTLEERRHAAEALLAAAPSSLGTILHCGTSDSNATLQLVRHAAALRPPAIAAMPPLMFNYDDESQRVHYHRVAESAPDVDVFAYENPGRFGYTLGPELMLRLIGEIPNLRGLKDSGDSLARISTYLAQPDSPVVYTGHNVLLLGGLVMGAAGAVSTLANVTPELFCAIVAAHRAGRLDEAREHQLLVVRLEQLIAGLPYVASVKRLLEWRGLPGGQPRLPLPQNTPELGAELERRLTRFPELREWLRPVS